MMLQQIRNIVTEKSNFAQLSDYFVFCQQYLNFITDNLQAVIVSQNESNYSFFQYRQDGFYNISRPINSELMYSADNWSSIRGEFIRILHSYADLPNSDDCNRSILRNSIYTIQQSIGAALDSLPSGQSNTARKINGDLFERLIRLLLNEVGIDCRTGVINVPGMVNGVEEFTMSYQDDLLLYNNSDLKVIGSVKTSSKDRIDKIFVSSQKVGENAG